MEINVTDGKKLVEVWLTCAEKQNPLLHEPLRKIYAENQKRGYMVAVYASGETDLYENTRDLLLFNRKRLAEQDVQQEKRKAQLLS